MNDEEKVTFMTFFKDYRDQVMKNRNSLLARIYGVFTVKIEKLKPVHLILMGNTIDAETKPLYVFDLKGSFINREVKCKPGTEHNQSCLKDINLLKLLMNTNLLKFTPQDKE